MQITFMRVLALWGIGLGCYLLLSLAFPRLRPRKWQDEPIISSVLGACFCILLGLWAFGIAHPYTWIAAILAWAIGFLIQCRGKKTAARERFMDAREAIVALILLLVIIAIMLRVFWG